MPSPLQLERNKMKLTVTAGVSLMGKLKKEKGVDVLNPTLPLP
jgi:hypothetical protein